MRSSVGIFENKSHDDQTTETTLSRTLLMETPSADGRAVMVTSISGYWSSDFIGAGSPAVWLRLMWLFTLTCSRLNVFCDWLLLCVDITDVTTYLLFHWMISALNQTIVCFFCFFLLFTTRLHQQWCHGVSLSVSLPRVHSVSLCGKTTKIQPKLKRSKVTPNPPALSLTRQPLSQEHYGKSSYGTDKRHHDQSPKNKSLKNCWPGTSYDWVLMKIQQDWSTSVHLVNS